MDCKTARLLLPYFDARAESLPAELAEAFEAHAGQCLSCSRLLRESARADRIIAVAMKDVEIPDGLQARLLAGLRRQRIRRRRTWPVRHARWSVAAAVLLLAVGGALGYWWQRPLPPLDISALAAMDSLEGQHQVEALFAEHGLRQAVPKQFRFNLLVSSGMEQIQGKLVPRLRFETREGQFAEVYILTSKEFNLTGSEEVSGNFLLVRDSDPNRAYLVRYGGGPLNWLFMNQGQGA